MIKKIIYTFGIGIFVAIFAAVIAYLNPLNSWHLKIADSLYTKNEPSDEIVIIGIDEVSISDQNGLGRFGSWSRAHYKEAIENLEEAGAKVIGFDLYLTEKQTSATKEYIKNLIKNPDKIKNYSPALDNPEDLELAETLAKYSNIVLAGNSEAVDGQPLPIFINHDGEEVGFININPDEDTVARRTPVENGFDLKIAQKYSPEAIDTYEIPLENNEMLINYFAGPYEYKSIPFVEVYRGNFDQSRVEGKIALIGVTTQKIKDHFATPKDKTIEMPGVEVRANSIQTILSGDYLQNQSQLSETITIIALALAVALILSLLNIWLATGIIIAIGVGYYGYAHFEYGRGVILNMIYPFITIALAYVATLAYKYFAELREKKYVKTAFGRYLSPNVMGEVLKNPNLLHLGGTKRNVTVFFSDIANFTTLSEGMKPEDLISQINDYLSAMTDIIMDLGGTLDKYVGDAIVAYFGAPLDMADHAAKACEAAIRMREKLPVLHKKWRAEGKPLADFRVGINSGFVVVGNVGSEKRFDYTILGDEVNLGSRLEGANKKYDTHMMISEATAVAISGESGAFVVRELDLLRVKGKKKPIKVYELIARASSLSGEGRELLERYNAGMALYLKREFGEALKEFDAALGVYAEDGPSKIYKQRCEVLRDFPPKPDWDGVFEMKEK